MHEEPALHLRPWVHGCPPSPRSARGAMTCPHPLARLPTGEGSLTRRRASRAGRLSGTSPLAGRCRFGPPGSGSPAAPPTAACRVAARPPGAAGDLRRRRHLRPRGRGPGDDGRRAGLSRLPRNSGRRGQDRLHRTLLHGTDRRYPVARPHAGLVPTGHGQEGAATVGRSLCRPPAGGDDPGPAPPRHADRLGRSAVSRRTSLFRPADPLGPGQLRPDRSGGDRRIHRPRRLRAPCGRPSRKRRPSRSARWWRPAACAAGAAEVFPPARSGSSPASGPSRSRAEVPDLQRRRRRSRGVHGSRRDRERSASRAGGHGHRRLCHRGLEGLHLHPRRISPGHQAAQGGHRPGRGQALDRRADPGQQLSRSR